MELSEEAVKLQPLRVGSLSDSSTQVDRKMLEISVVASDGS